MQRITPGHDQESVWDYPRPPRLEPTNRRLRVVFAGVLIVDTSHAWRVCETASPPVYYFPPGAVRRDYLRRAPRATFCEWKGQAAYWDVVVGERVAPAAAWSYPAPTRPFVAIRDHLAFYASAMDTCTVDGELAQPQPGYFYGGWITHDIVGPFKGGPGTGEW